jgi:hypothetical protein
VVRWRCADLGDRIAAKFHVYLHERSVGKLLKKLNFSNMSGRPVHPQSDLEAQAAFKKRMARPVCKRFYDLVLSVCDNVSGLRTIGLAKMEIRASWSS